MRSRPPLSDLAEFLAAIRRHWGQAVTGGTAVALLALAQQWFTLQGDAGKKIVSALPAVAIAWFVIAVPVACFLAWRDKHYELRAVEAGRDAALRDCDLARKEL
ncbi:MAG: hypothetical protein JOZ24_06440, partial [Candidatus Eremiobacteraeota bacterium]|nr:hypothetical protein [Candidatus Eremiobacteraeota bacterium]